MIPIGTPGSAIAVDDTGQGVGRSDLTAGIGTQHAFPFTDGQIYDLTSLIPPQSRLTITTARNIDDQERVLAAATTASHAEHTAMLAPGALPEPTVLTVSLIFVGSVGIHLALRNRFKRRLQPRFT